MAKTKQRLTPAQVAANIEAKFGTNTMVLAKNAIGLVKPRFSTGSFALDLLTGGGAPEGSIEVILGRNASGKSLGLMKRAGSFLKKHPDAVFVLINAEKTNDPPFLELNGIDLERTYIVEPNSGEEAWDIIHEVAKTAEKVYIGVDSLDAMVPLAELEADMDEHKMAPAARQNNKGFRKLITFMKSDITTTDHRITLGIIAQVRESIGIMFGDNEKPVGGKGSEYAAMQIIKCRKVKDLRTEGKTLMDKSCYGAVFEAKVQKSKGRGQGETIQYTYYKENYGDFKKGEIDNVSELIPFALRHKIIRQAGAWFDFEDHTGTTQKLHGGDNVSSYLAKNTDCLEFIIAEVYKMEDARHKGIVYSPAKTDSADDEESTPIKKKKRAAPKRKIKK